MKRVMFLLCLIFPLHLHVIAQKWEIKKSIDDFGDPSGKKYLSQIVDATMGSESIKIKITLDLPKSEYFIFTILDKAGVPFAFPLNIQWPDPDIDKLLFRYKTGDTEFSFPIEIPLLNLSFKNQFRVKYSSLNPILMNSSSQIKCIITKEYYQYNYTDKNKDGKLTGKKAYGDPNRINLFLFTIYSANYNNPIQ